VFFVINKPLHQHDYESYIRSSRVKSYVEMNQTPDAVKKPANSYRPPPVSQVPPKVMRPVQIRLPVVSQNVGDTD
jgi:hypothetical protein